MPEDQKYQLDYFFSNPTFFCASTKCKSLTPFHVCIQVSNVPLNLQKCESIFVGAYVHRCERRKHMSHQHDIQQNCKLENSSTGKRGIDFTTPLN